MVCERCNKRTAKVHLTQVINNKKTEINVCEYCARDLHQEAWGVNFHDFLGGLMVNGYSTPVKSQQDVTCQECGITQYQFVKGGLLGCGKCYEVFQDQIIPLAKRIHGTVQHTGKVPKRTGGRARISKEIRTLKASLQEYISREEFEKAVELRDKIRLLEEQLK